MSSQLLDSVLLQTDFPELKLHASGKVRDIYLLDSERLLFVATDRISAFDYVLATGIPHKGRVLTQISLFWFDFLRDLVPNHLITADVSQYPAALQKYADQLRGPFHDRDPGGYVSGGMRGAWIHFRFGLKGIQSYGESLRHRTSQGPARIGSLAGADFHPIDQSHQWS